MARQKACDRNTDRKTEGKYLASRVSRSDLPKKAGGRHCMHWGTTSNSPTGTYLYRKLSHSRRNRLQEQQWREMNLAHACIASSGNV